MLSVFRYRPHLSVTAKFIIIYLSILAASLSVTGLILYVQASKSTIAQAQVVMEQNVQQKKDNISEKIKMIENVSQIIAYDTKIQTFLGSAFTNESFQLEEYRDNTAPILENIMRQNTYIHSIRIYMENNTIPELYDGFYHLDRIRNEEGYADFILNREGNSNWMGLHPEKTIVSLPGVVEKNEVFSFCRKMFSAKYLDLVGLLEIEVKQEVLFDSLNNSSARNLGRIFVADHTGTIVSQNIPDLYKKHLVDLGIPQLPGDLKFNEIVEMGGNSSILISIPLEGLDFHVVGLFPVSNFNGKVKDSLRTMMLVLLVALLVLSVLVYFITNALLARMKVLVKAMKQVRNGSLDISVPVVSNDEFSQMALSFNHMTRRIHELVETVYKTKIMEKEAELRALESQIKPHFLYNTLATISWVARKSNSPEITHLSNTLAKFYRLVLNKGRSIIMVRDEIEMVRTYVQIQKFRFEDLFDIVFEVDEEIYKYHTAKNILQPLVENALIHGIEPKRAHGTIIIKAGSRDDRLFYQVIDDGVGIQKDKIDAILQGQVDNSSGSGYAIKNIMERLDAYYGDQHSFELFGRPGIGTVITITFAKGVQR
ncbi:sensor histidine kinase [Paenibacillus sp. LjRoot153]|uniref:cache domain-containing sensor histidine kinase n=1 Tax=Paenibacillus sp. LjRoot153 TaxID=3342270 RepID=UPI003ECEB615